MDKEALSRLSVTRKADRAEMAEAFGDLGERVGAEVEVREGKREVVVHVTRDGLSVMVMLNPRIHPKLTFLAHWNTKRAFDPTFATIIRPASVNEFHGCKATQQADDFYHLISRIEGGFEAAVDGRAFEDQMRDIAANGSMYDRPPRPAQTPGYPPWNRPDLRVISYLRDAVPDPNGQGASYWLPRDMIGHDGKTAILYRLASDGEYTINGWEPWHDGMFGGRYATVDNALAWVDRAIAVRAGTAKDFLGV